MLKLLKRIFHKHDWVKVDFRQEYDGYRNMRYAIKIYKCSECGKVKETDGRHEII